MSKADICHGEFLRMGDPDAILGELTDATATKHEMGDLNYWWSPGPNDPGATDVEDVAPFKSRDVVAFRSKPRGYTHPG